MSVASANVFALLDDEGTVDAGELVAKLPVAQKEAPKKASEETKQASRAPASGAARGGRSGEAAKGGRGGRSRPASGADESADADAAPSRGQTGRGGNRNRGGGGRGRPDGRRREFDRHDASGRGHETEKRHGQGKGNWGAEGEEATEDLDKKLNIAADGADGEEVVEEPEEKQMSLEEYEAMQAEKRAALNAQRKTTIEVDAKQFDGMKAFEKVEEDVGLDLSKNVKMLGTNKTGRERERKERDVLTDVGFRVANADNRSSRGGSGRGARGGRPRVRNERAGRGGRGPAIRIDDSSAFPTLG